MNMTFSAMARGLVLQRLWPVNRKRGALLDRRERLGIPMKRAAFSLPAHFGCDAGLERDVDDREEAVKEQMRDHIRQSIKQGRTLNWAYDNGRFEAEMGPFLAPCMSRPAWINAVCFDRQSRGACHECVK